MRAYLRVEKLEGKMVEQRAAKKAGSKVTGPVVPKVACLA